MNVEIGTEAEQFPEKEYMNGISIAMFKMGQEEGYRHAESH